MPSQRPANVLPLPRWTILIHGVQILFAVVVLGLDAYGIHYVPYNALIFSVVAALLTMLFTVYIVGTSLFVHKLYNQYIVMGMHALMIIIWIADMGLVANLARIWSQPQCDYYYDAFGYVQYYCNYKKRDQMGIEKRDTTTVKSYYGALCAGAFFGAVEVATWAFSLVMVVLYINKRAKSNSTATHAPSTFAGNQQAISMDHKYGTAAPTPQPMDNTYQQQQQQPYPAAQTPQHHYAQPVTASHPEPVNRVQSVSPVSQAGYSTSHPNPQVVRPQHTGGYHPDVSEISSPQYTGSNYETVPELSSGRH